MAGRCTRLFINNPDRPLPRLSAEPSCLARNIIRPPNWRPTRLSRDGRLHTKPADPVPPTADCWRSRATRVPDRHRHLHVQPEYLLEPSADYYKTDADSTFPSDAPPPPGPLPAIFMSRLTSHLSPLPNCWQTLVGVDSRVQFLPTPYCRYCTPHRYSTIYTNCVTQMVIHIYTVGGN